MPAGIQSSYPGSPLWDLHDHLVEQTYPIHGSAYAFDEAWIHRLDFDGARLELPVGPGLGPLEEPSFFIDLKRGGRALYLGYGWENATYHDAHSWSLGRWRQDCSATCGNELDLCQLSLDLQLPNLEAIHRAVEHELALLCSRLTRASQAGAYPLQWAEVAALLCRFRDDWNEHTRSLEHPDGIDWSEYRSAVLDAFTESTARLTVNGRGGALTLAISHGGERLITFQARRDTTGWRLDAFTPFNGNGCPWWGGVAFHGDSLHPDRHRVACPRSHNHEDALDIIAPWNLSRHFLEDWFPLLANRYEWNHLRRCT